MKKNKVKKAEINSEKKQATKGNTSLSTTKGRIDVMRRQAHFEATKDLGNI